MIKTEGTLRIKRIRQSRNGAFCIADLSTDFGEFKVKDPMLDQFDEGEYQGTLWISEIYMSQYIAYGKAVTELRARLHDLQIDAEDRNAKPQAEPAEIDPLDEAPPSSLPKPAPTDTGWADLASNQLRNGSPATQPGRSRGEQGFSDASGGRAKAPDLSMFDEAILALIEQGNDVKLDPTVDRALFRSQTGALRLLGYVFNAKQQDWHKAS